MPKQEIFKVTGRGRLSRYDFGYFKAYDSAIAITKAAKWAKDNGLPTSTLKELKLQATQIVVKEVFVPELTT